MNRNDVIYTQTDSALNRFFAKTYGLVDVGIGLSASVPFLMSYVLTNNMVSIIVYHPFVYYGVILLELVLVLSTNNAARKSTPVALPLFLFYSTLNGSILSFVIVAYAQTTVVQTLASSASVFGVMVIVGASVKGDLSGMVKAFVAVLIGVIIAGLVNMFIGSGIMSYIISIISVLVFSNLITYNNQMIKRVYESAGSNVGDDRTISMALNPYLGFINLFLSLPRIFENND